MLKLNCSSLIVPTSNNFVKSFTKPPYFAYLETLLALLQQIELKTTRCPVRCGLMLYRNLLMTLFSDQVFLTSSMPRED